MNAHILLAKFKLYPVRYMLNLIQIMLCVCAATLCVSLANQPQPMSNTTDASTYGVYEPLPSKADIANINKQMKGFAVVELEVSRGQLFLDNGTTMYSIKHPKIEVYPSYANNMGIIMERGRFVKATEELVLSHSVALAVFGNTNPIGRKVKMQWQSATVVGVAQDAAAGSPDGVVGGYMSYSGNQPKEVFTFRLKLLTEPTIAKERFFDLLKQPYPKTTFYWTAQNSNSNTFFLVFVVFAVIALISCAAGIFAMQLIDNSSHTKELGLRQAMGAQTGALVRERLAENAIFVLLASLLGLGLSKYAIMALERTVGKQLFPAGMYYDAKVAAVVVAIMLLVGLLASWYPAIQAARLKPTVALKED